MSCNCATPRGIEVKNSDTQSEVSESGTATSGFNSNWGSREELRDFVAKHGLKDISDLYQDRFRVDRKKLEQMLSGDNDALIPADVFFANIMEDTDTYITWPNKLKLGAKSKKDPHVRIAGKEEDVKAAKDRIMTVLYTRCNRVTMKMDISYTDHSHIIGRGGLSIKRVMEETQCHVHFPDSNRSNPMEKSNQVSISGDLEGVENARSRVRELIPLIFGFEPPIMAQNIDNTCPYVIKIQEQYKVQVMFKTRSKLHATIVLVKGVEWEVEQVKQATILLMEYMCENLTNQIPVQMTIQISPQHHAIVLGKNHSNLKAIMHYTKCQIMFPDAQDQNIPSLKRSNVNISGNIHSVYTARQLLIGSLPLLIIFDLPEDIANLKVRSEQIDEIQNTCDVTITVRQKSKQMIKACIIKGIERQASNIYKARNLILGIDDPPIQADIPRLYHIPSTPSPNNDLLTTPTNLNPSPLTPIFTWHFSSDQTTPFEIVQKPQMLYNNNNNKMQQSSNSSGFQSFEQVKADTSLLSSISSNSSNYVSSPPTVFSPQSDNNIPTTSDYQSMNEKKSASFDYDCSKRLAGFKAMQGRPNPDVYRVPTAMWAGYGISHTSPAGMLKKEDDIWKPAEVFPSTSGLHNTSNILDHTPTHFINRIANTTWSDLPSLLSALGLDRYISLFIRHEVDLPTFTTLSDKDLMTIGVTAFGSRRKMLLAISELNKRSCTFSAAPGAERKSSSSNSPPSHDNSPRQSW
ncbi:Protein bicaudal C-like Protein [Tribolium castaneum]|uniref:Protein bicaudal C-like Protein n=1 Tax=Tribolium castaneum TaxID=7070 RepID=D6WV91_TRICA|nr:PREDICTED: protein bicaudal C [Tribolium castaneum]EFA07761.1 Protein bicaudal C-like Protein [Tribolium castaneum]|eukprot:XP_974970.1 PREDICTED: protein bicaudal C [Tribolium castaneum]